MTAPPNHLRRGAALLDAPVLAGLIVLLAAGGYLRYAKAHGQLQILKLAAPLQRPLTELSERVLAPYALQERSRLSEDSEHELGTRDYIQWIFEDATAPAGDWRRRISLFVTYYTGMADQVPHVPDECYAVGAFSQSSVQDLAFTLAGPTGAPRALPVRRLVFMPPRGEGPSVIVYYTFVVNGDFYCSRDGVRSRMRRTDERYLYYSKIELSFHSLAAREATPEMDRHAEKLLGQTLDAMQHGHLPDTEAMEHAAPGS
ncbi:MAG: hypothetical protein U1A27_14250 [Phycisphaerae bacterium]